jgi:hypothetical protein
MSTIHTGLTGEGEVDMTGASFPGLFRVKVTDLGIAHPVGGIVTIPRYVDIGWLAPFESGVPTDQGGPDKCYFKAQFIEYTFQSFDWVQFVQNINGIDGLHYFLQDGVVADIVVV